MKMLARNTALKVWSFCEKCVHRYNHWLTVYPWRTQLTSTAGLMTIGDFIAQYWIEEHRDRKTYDFIRTCRFAFMGFCVVGPALKVWYKNLDRFVKPSKFALVKKVCLDQLLYAPPFLAGFVIVIGCLRFDPPSDIWSRLKQDYPDIMRSNYMLWPAVQFINFHFIPLSYRVVFVQAVAIGWNTYLAYTTSKLQVSFRPQYKVLAVNSVSVLWNTYMSWKAERKPHDHAHHTDLDSEYLAY